MAVLLYYREFIMLGIIIPWYVTWMYKDTSMCQTDKGRIFIAILGFQFKFKKKKLKSSLVLHDFYPRVQQTEAYTSSRLIY